MFLKGFYNEIDVDNTKETNFNDWLSALKKIKPSHLMIYSLDRTPPASNLIKVEYEELKSIAEKVKAVINTEIILTK